MTARDELLRLWRDREAAWEHGRCTSPSPNDFLHDAEQVLTTTFTVAASQVFFQLWDEGATNLELVDWLVGQAS